MHDESALLRLAVPARPPAGRRPNDETVMSEAKDDLSGLAADPDGPFLVLMPRLAHAGLKQLAASDITYSESSYEVLAQVGRRLLGRRYRQ